MSSPTLALGTERPSNWQTPTRPPGIKALVLAWHGLVILGLLQSGHQEQPSEPPRPVRVSLLSDTPAFTEKPGSSHPSVALPHLPRLVLPVPVPEISAQDAELQTRAVIAQPRADRINAPPLPRAPVEAEAPAHPATSPKAISASSLRYRVEPAVELPRLSRRAGEHGQVQLRVVFDAEGRPHDIQLQRSSGFARLDAQAIEAMQAARIEPHLEGGQAIPVLALACLEYPIN